MTFAETANISADLAARLRVARRVVALTGAGISAESGIPTFRDAMTGLWARFRPEELATPQAFLRDPKLVWDWYAWRRSRVEAAEPNAGHRALAELESRVPDFLLVTQNVDGLHERAGSTGVLEYHGNILRDRCMDEQAVRERVPGPDGLPHCATCGALLRPDVVWFGEAIPAEPMRLADAAARACDVFLSVGTSSLVYPAAGLAEIALRQGATIIEINPNPTDLSSCAEAALRGPSGRVLPELLAAL